MENKNPIMNGFWAQNVDAQPVVIWRSYAFENVCFNHIAEIKRALGISGISSTESAWTKRGECEKGTQIDLLILRKDNVVNMCEMKFYSDNFVVDREYEEILRNRQRALYEKLPKKNTIHNTLITTYGIKDNEYRWSFEKVITLEDLFS